ncbi:V-set and immunoglobulin domain-containing protein 4 isoform X2 [Trichosurus vulpecula]|uniref:V-set and immunoglobulin domain-containing protein 4 isoform X2 n=1 Tax=Trichosurus vulpecula TaxID=9337 RepID=UPI00186ACA35|nr:V-set and immunoglobulin domain-containing protein 4 isoform X2 [Trichosurus vulpecula]
MTVMALFLGLALLAHLSGHLNAMPTLEGPVKMTGPWKGNVNIACTYGPMEGYTQILVKWLVQQDNDPVTIFLRDSSGDHIQQAKYRGRLQVSREPPGDVSLLLETLEMDDRGRYLCQVTWKGPDGRHLMRERQTELQIQKLPASKPLVTTGSGYGFQVPHGMRISLLCQAQGSPPITYKWYKGQPDGNPTQVTSLGTLLFKPAQVSDSGTYFCVAKARIGSEQTSDVVHFVVTDSSKKPTSATLPEELTASTLSPEVIHQSTTVTPAKDQPSTTGSFSGASTIGLATYSAATETSSGKQTTMEAGHAGTSSERPGSISGVASKDQKNASKRTGGQGLPLYAIVLIALLCLVLVFATIFGFCRRKSQDHTYEVARMSTGDVPRVAVYSGGTAEAEAETRALENEYQNDPTSIQDYQIITQANSDYARLLCGSSSPELEIQENGKPTC